MMAKCIQVVGQGIPVRMSDDDAFQVVERDHDGQYCSKNVWRDWYAEAGDLGLRKLAFGDNPGDGRTKLVETKTLQRQDQHKRGGGGW
jgi:hypothetical protein